MVLWQVMRKLDALHLNEPEPMFPGAYPRCRMDNTGQVAFASK